MTQKVNIEEIKKYKKAIRTGQEICYCCGTISPECGMVQMVSVNIDPEAISDSICKDCYSKAWKETSKNDFNIEDTWELAR